MKVQGARIALTGASSGLGRALALAAADRGARAVALIARSEGALREVALEVERRGAAALVLVGDVAHGDQAAELAARAEEGLGGVDIAIANAGISQRSRATDFDAARFRHLLDVNLVGAAAFLGALVPTQVARGRGQLVAVSSVAAYKGLPGNGFYSSSKAALSNLMESWRLELAPRGVVVTLVEPGFIRTPMVEKNRFHMPFLVEPEDAAARVLNAVEADRARLVFPWQMGVVMGLLRHLPEPLFLKLGQTMLKTEEPWEKG